MTGSLVLKVLPTLIGVPKRFSCYADYSSHLAMFRLQGKEVKLTYEANIGEVW